MTVVGWKKHRRHGTVLVGHRPWDHLALPQEGGNYAQKDAERIPPIPPPSPFRAAQEKLARKR